MQKTITRAMRRHFFKGRYPALLQGVRTLSEKAPYPKANIVFFPGYRQHVGLYVPLLDRLVKEGFNIFGCDPPNHGLSVRDERDRGFISNFNDYLRFGKAMTYYRLWSAPYKEIPTFLMGHSLGALLVLRLLELKIPLRNSVRGAICLSTPLAVDHNLSSWARFAKPALEFLDSYFGGNSLWDRLPVDHPQESTLLRFSEDKDFYRGPLFLRTAKEINDTAILTGKALGKIHVPTLFVHGDADVVAPLSGIQNIMKTFPSPERTLEIIHGCDHYVIGTREPYSITEEQVVKTFVGWLRKRL